MQSQISQISNKMKNQDNDSSINNSENPKHNVVVLMVPLPAQGHLNQVLHLSHLITSYGIAVHYACSSSHNRQAKARLQGWHHDHDHDHENKTTSPSKIQFHDFQIPHDNLDQETLTHPSPPCTNPNTENHSVELPTHMQTLFAASTRHLREPTHQLVEQLSVEFDKVIVIHDMLMAYVVQDVKLVPNAEAFTFIPFPAFTMFVDSWRFIPENFKPFHLQHNDIPPSYGTDLYQGSMTPELFNFVIEQFQLLGFESGWLYNTSRVFEGRYVTLLEKLNARIKHFALGPLHPILGFQAKQKHYCLQWLDKQEEGSVIYVSFGSLTTFKCDQVRELANGLDQCGQRFIWVLRKADSNDAFAHDNEGTGESNQPQLPQGYEERVKDKGIVVRDWAPQLEILAHKSVGGFISHCGWNSCIESLSMGVPIVAWPIHSDQSRNAVLVTQVLKVGVVVRDWARRNELVTSEMIETAVNRLMVSEEGKEMRERAVKIGEDIRGSVAESGASSTDRNDFIAYITS